MKVKRILLGLGGTEYTPVAIRRAIELARRHEAEITGATVVDDSRLRDVGPVPVGGGRAARALREYRMDVTRKRVSEAIEVFRDCCATECVPSRLCQETGEPFSLMTNLARYHDVMVFGLRSVFDCGLGVDPQDTLARLVRGGVHPLIAVSREYREIGRVLLAYSGSPQSAKTVRRFVQSRLWPGVRLRLLTCGRSADEAEDLLANMAAYCRAHGHTPEVEHSREQPGAGILAAAAEWDADLIVLGNGAGSLWLNRILGGTALHVIRNADRPLYLSQ